MKRIARRLDLNVWVAGFTLVELLVVIAIIGTLGAIVIAGVNSARVLARDVKRIAELRQIQKALELYYADYAAYPNTQAYVSRDQDVSWTTVLQPALAPYISPLPSERYYGHYLYSAKNNAQKYGLMANVEHSSNYDLVNNDGGYFNANESYYELGSAPAECASVGKDWWASGIYGSCP